MGAIQTLRCSVGLASLAVWLKSGIRLRQTQLRSDRKLGKGLRGHMRLYSLVCLLLASFAVSSREKIAINHARVLFDKEGAMAPSRGDPFTSQQSLHDGR